MRYITFFIFLILGVFFSSFSYGIKGHSPPSPEKGDADFFMENLGKENFRERIERDTGSPSYSALREDFGGGMLSSSIGSTADEAPRGVVIQTDGKVVVVGRFSASIGSASADDFFIARYFPDGSLDNGFGTNGSLTIDFSTLGDTAHAVSLQTDGKLLLYGKADVGALYYSDFAIARVTASGTLDTTFFTNGKRLVTIGLSQEVARAGIQDANGAILISGYTWTRAATRYDAAIVRLMSNGTLDTAFDTDARKVTQLTGVGSFFYGITLQTDGHIVAAGTSDNSTDWDFSVARYNSDGSVDTTFNTSGKRNQAVLSSNDIAWGVTIATQGTIILAGESANANADFAAMRIHTDGTLDTAFKTVGYTTFVIGAGADVAYGVQVQTNGNPVLGGYSHNGTNNDFAIARLVSNGTLDTAFDSDGKNTQAIGSSTDVATGISMAGDDYIVLGGRMTNGAGNLDIAIARYQTNGTLGRSGQLDYGFGTTGTLVYQSNPIAIGGAAVSQQDGKIVSIGAGFNGVTDLGYVIFRLLPNGNLDTTFFTDGETIVNFDPANTDISYGVWIQTDGKILVSGAEDSDDIVDQNIGIARVLTSGELDTSFHTDGRISWDASGTNATDISYGITQDSAGKVVMSGGGGGVGVLARFEADGTFDTSFSTDGYDRSAFPGQSLFLGMRNTLDTGGEIYLNGWVSNDGGTNSQPAVRKFMPNGSLDTAFHTDGSLIVATLNVGLPGIASGITRFSDGSIFFGGTNTTPDFAVWKLRSDGSLDTAFSTDGTQTTNFSGGDDLISNNVILGNGKVFVGGYASAASTDFGIARYATDGALDTYFDTDGKAVFDFGDVEAALSVFQSPTGKHCLVGYQATNGTYYPTFACYWP